MTYIKWCINNRNVICVCSIRRCNLCVHTVNMFLDLFCSDTQLLFYNKVRNSALRNSFSSLDLYTSDTGGYRWVFLQTTLLLYFNIFHLAPSSLRLINICRWKKEINIFERSRVYWGEIKVQRDHSTTTVVSLCDSYLV
jgi:hypothetical protein